MQSINNVAVGPSVTAKKLTRPIPLKKEKAEMGTQLVQLKKTGTVLLFVLPALKWISSSQTVMLSVIIVTVWKSLGYAMIFYLAALEKVPAELYEASDLDGANAFQRFCYMTLPSISPTTFFLMIITMVNSLQVYDQIQILIQGGPSGSTRTFLYMYYQLGFQKFHMGQAAATAVVMILITVLLSCVQFSASKKWVNY